MSEVSSPAASGYHMPAEWAAHEGTWFSWPHNPETWPGVLARAEAALADTVHALCSGEDVHLSVLDANHEAHVRTLLRGHPQAVYFHHLPTNDAWCRDHGAIFVVNTAARQPRLAINWGFNAWGGKYPPYDLDDAVPEKMAATIDTPVIDGGMILEGGAIEVNGAGSLMTTESCLLSATRNPHLKRADIEQRLRDMLGVTQVLWLPGGDVIGDDTDGHVDNLARFVNKTTIVAPCSGHRSDPNYRVLSENFETLQGLQDPVGRAFQIVALPVPEPVMFEGQQLPASYANFYIGNEVVLVPAFNQPADAAANEILTDFFPGREVVSIDCRDIVVGLGALHCLSQQIPAVTGAEPSPST